MTKLIKYLRTVYLVDTGNRLLLSAGHGRSVSAHLHVQDCHVGIQQNGIQNAVPQGYCRHGVSPAYLFIDDTHKADVSAAYRLVDESDLNTPAAKKYPWPLLRYTCSRRQQGPEGAAQPDLVGVIPVVPASSWTLCTSCTV